MQTLPKEQFEVFQAGRQARIDGRGADANPYWPDYGKKPDKTPEEEQILARIWVDGYVEACLNYANVT